MWVLGPKIPPRTPWVVTMRRGRLRLARAGQAGLVGARLGLVRAWLRLARARLGLAGPGLVPRAGSWCEMWVLGPKIQPGIPQATPARLSPTRRWFPQLPVRPCLAAVLRRVGVWLCLAAATRLFRVRVPRTTRGWIRRSWRFWSGGWPGWRLRGATSWAHP